MSGSNFTHIISALGWFVDISTTGLIPAIQAHDQGVHLNKATYNILSCMQFPLKQYDTAESENSLTFVRFAWPALQGRRSTQFVRMI
jgi:hypothetical protein